jgi:MoxR-like ATPase
MARGVSPVSPSEFTGHGSTFYRAPDAVANTVNLAIQLCRPILVEGEPGCGKTKLAYAIAAELQLGRVTKITVKSSTQARDLLYRFDALRRLQDVQDPTRKDARYIFPYIQLGQLGDAIHRPERCVVLIDEIDKADIDFPNDLLDVLDEMSFTIDELPQQEEELSHERHGFGRIVARSSEAAPVIVITSNREKQLPDPFLRRCLYVHLRFPQSAEEVQQIAELNLRESRIDFNKELVEAAAKAFQSVRAAALRGDARKPPTTSELIDWVKILHWRGVSPDELRASPLLPRYWEVLFKTQHDLESFPAAAARGETS